MISTLASFFLIAAAADSAVDAAIGHMKTAEKKVPAAKGRCAVAVQVHAARMQLEVAREVKDDTGARSMSGGLKELAQEAKAQCPNGVGEEIDLAIAALAGEVAAVSEDDIELKPEQPEIKGPATAPAKSNEKPVLNPPPAQHPFIWGATPLRAAPSRDEERVHLVRQLDPGFKPLGVVLKGLGRRTDWMQTLEVGKCYAFVGFAGPEAKRIALYLWDMNGRRVVDSRSREPRALMYFCPAFGGAYHLQAKIKRDAPYDVSVFVR
jgi:hypothetical protein